MSAFLILLVLTLGYHYISNVPLDRIELRKSTGWETQVRLAYRGFRYVILGTVIFALLYLFLLLVLSVLDYVFNVEWKLAIKKSLVFILFDDVQVYHLIIALFTYSICQSEIKQERQKSLDELLENKKNKFDGMLEVILHATVKQFPIRVSLKSRKVYVGLILGEQFERADVDCIVLIPLASGYREKDNLDVDLNWNYYDVYKNNGVFKDVKDGFDKSNMVNLQEFQFAIRVNEIESVSLFEFSLLDQFKLKKGTVPDYLNSN